MTRHSGGTNGGIQRARTGAGQGESIGCSVNAIPC